MNTAIVLCPGPSLDFWMLHKFHEVADVYAVNRSVRIYDRTPLTPKAVFVLDKPEKFAEDIGHFKGQTLIVDAEHESAWHAAEPRILLGFPIRREHPYADPFAAPLEAPYHHPLKSTLYAVQYLGRVGYKTIGIAGCDCKATDQRYFFSHQPPTEGEREHCERHYGQVRTELSRYRTLLEARGQQLVNLSPGSGLAAILPTKSIEELL